MKNAPRKLAILLRILLAAFCLRVCGQMFVAFLGVSWLPPMESWYSGLMPYPYLLSFQFLLIGLMSKVCFDFTRGEGFFVRSRPFFGQGLLVFGYLYLVSMIVRYIVQMGLYPETRWFGGTIPIVFHWVLACFVVAFGRHHRSRLINAPRSS